MNPTQFLSFDDKTLDAGVALSEDITGGAAHRLIFDVTANVTNPASPQINAAGAAAILKDVRLTQNGSTIASAPGIDLYFATRLFNGGVSGFDDPAAAGAVSAHAVIDLDFSRIMPGAVIDGSGGNRMGYRVEIDDDAVYHGGTAAGVGGLLKVRAEHRGGVAVGGLLTPRISFDDLDASTATTNLNLSKVFQQPGHLLGFSVRVFDNSQNNNVKGQDGLIKRLKVKHVRPNGGQSELFDGPWSFVKQMTSNLFRVPDAQDMRGFAFYPFRVAQNAARAGALPIGKNDTVQITFDTTGTADAWIPNVNPGANDRIIVTFWFFEESGAGPQDLAQRGTLVAGNGARRGTARRGRRARVR